MCLFCVTCFQGGSHASKKFTTGGTDGVSSPAMGRIRALSSWRISGGTTRPSLSIGSTSRTTGCGSARASMRLCGPPKPAAAAVGGDGAVARARWESRPRGVWIQLCQASFMELLPKPPEKPPGRTISSMSCTDSGGGRGGGGGGTCAFIAGAAVHAMPAAGQSLRA